MAFRFTPSNPSAQPLAPDPLYDAIFSKSSSSLGDKSPKADPFLDLKVGTKRATWQTAVEVDSILDSVRTHFKPSDKEPAPYIFFDRHKEFLPEAAKSLESRELWDLAAVVTGQKPAALLKSSDTLISPFGRELLKRAAEQGLTITTSVCSGEKQDQSLLVGTDENVRRLASAFYELTSLPRNMVTSARQWDPPHEKCHREIGEALGYPNEAIDRFINGDTIRDNFTVGRMLKFVAAKVIYRLFGD